MRLKHSPRRGTGKELAAFLGCHRSTITRLTSSGLLEKEDGLYDFAESVRRWKLRQETLQRSAQSSTAKSGLELELLAQKVRTLELRNNAKEAALIPIEDVRRTCSRAFRELMEALFQMPRENAQVVGTLQPHEIEAHETKRLRAALTQVSDNTWPGRKPTKKGTSS